MGLYRTIGASVRQILRQTAGVVDEHYLSEVVAGAERTNGLSVHGPMLRLSLPEQALPGRDFPAHDAMGRHQELAGRAVFHQHPGCTREVGGTHIDHRRSIGP